MSSGVKVAERYRLQTGVIEGRERERVDDDEMLLVFKIGRAHV